MIATLVFSVILLVISMAVIRFTHDYFRGVNTSTTQNIARNSIDMITQAIQFSSAEPTPVTLGGGYGGAQSYCVGGNQQFVYYLGDQVDSTHHGLLHIQSAPCTSTPVLTDGVELLQPHMHLAVFDINAADATNATWDVDIKIVYADNDTGITNSLLCEPSITIGSCNDGSFTANLSTATPSNELRDLHCKAEVGSEFCSVVELTTTVDRRLVGS